MRMRESKWIPSEHPYDLAKIRRALEEVDDGCVEETTRDGELTSCWKPVVAIRRYYFGEGYEEEPDEDEDGGGFYNGVCAYHAVHDVVPLSIVLKALREDDGNDGR